MINLGIERNEENVENFDNRVKEVFNYIMKTIYQIIAIVSHGGYLEAYTKYYKKARKNIKNMRYSNNRN